MSRTREPPPTGRSSFAARLLAWFDEAERDLPWRRDRRPYAVLVSELMLQQTTVAAVAPKYEAFMAAFPDWTSLAAADPEAVLARWAGLGYYRRAARLQAAARIVVDDHGGELPADPRAVRDLPGVGPYTAGAVLSLAFGFRRAAIDVNAARVLSRHAGQARDPARAPDRRALEDLALALMPPDRAGRFNEALMELGATCCTPRSPACGACPVAADCRARIDGRQEELRPPSTVVETRPVEAAAALVLRRGRVLLRRRDEDAALLPGLWELPGGFVDEGTPRRWLGRRVLTTLGGGEVAEEVTLVRHAITHRRIALHVFACRLTGAVPRAPALRWLRPTEAGHRGLTGATARALRQLGLG